jgi:hypothetical protein
MTYSLSQDKKVKQYKGEWSMNIRHGYGEMTLRDGTILKGQFTNNQAMGEFRVIFLNGDIYNGNVLKGIFHEEGELRQADGQIYKGQFRNGIK